MNREVRKVVIMQRYLMELKHIRKWIKKWRRRKHDAKMRIYAEDVDQEQCYNYRLFEAWDNQALPFCTMSLVSGRNTRNWPNLIFSIIHPQEINTQVYQWTKPPGDEWVINWKAFFPLSNTFELSRLFQDCIDNFQSNFFPDWTTIASSFCFQDLSKLSVNCLSPADEQWGCAAHTLMRRIRIMLMMMRIMHLIKMSMMMIWLMMKRMMMVLGQLSTTASVSSGWFPEALRLVKEILYVTVQQTTNTKEPRGHLRHMK